MHLTYNRFRVNFLIQFSVLDNFIWFHNLGYIYDFVCVLVMNLKQSDVTAIFDDSGVVAYSAASIVYYRQIIQRKLDTESHGVNYWVQNFGLLWSCHFEILQNKKINYNTHLPKNILLQLFMLRPHPWEVIFLWTLNMCSSQQMVIC